MEIESSIPGLVVRASRGPQEADALYAIREACAIRDRVDPLNTAESWPDRERISVSLSKAVTENTLDRLIVAEVNGLTVGYTLIIPWREADGTRVYLHLGWVVPEYRGRGIGTVLLAAIEERIRRLAAEQHPHARAEFAANASSTEQEATALLLNNGYWVAYTVLQMDFQGGELTPVPLPHGIQVRPVLPEHYPLIGASIYRAYAKEIPGGRFTEDYDPAMFAQEASEQVNDLALWQVAWDGDQVAGQVIARIEKGRAEIAEVSVLPQWRRRGLARALLVRVLNDLHERGEKVIRLHTNTNFPTRARDLYHSVGFRIIKEFPRYRKSFDHIAV